MTGPGDGWLRRAGRGTLADGAVVRWSVAEGDRGRRWRWILSGPDGTLRHVGLIELDRDGAFGRLELETGEGMVTLHPAGDGSTAHGNVVTDGGVRPIRIAWPAGSWVAIEGDPFGSALATTPGEASGEGWLVRGSILRMKGIDRGTRSAVTLDPRGVPVLVDGVEWALETP
ncbi:MAG TPA: hypothetical protein VD763_10725 [Candidatus Saccharimonadales bacterium]|nr:hypothetical protein [Candidatus Saccharimonadales bacterium]